MLVYPKNAFSYVNASANLLFKNMDIQDYFLKVMEITAQLTGTALVHTSRDQAPDLQTSKRELLILIILDLP